MTITTVMAVAIDAHACAMYETWRVNTGCPDSLLPWRSLPATIEGPCGSEIESREFWRLEALRLSEECHRLMPDLSKNAVRG